MSLRLRELAAAASQAKLTVQAGPGAPAWLVEGLSAQLAGLGEPDKPAARVESADLDTRTESAARLWLLGPDDSLAKPARGDFVLVPAGSTDDPLPVTALSKAWAKAGIDLADALSILRPDGTGARLLLGRLGEPRQSDQVRTPGLFAVRPQLDDTAVRQAVLAVKLGPLEQARLASQLTAEAQAAAGLAGELEHARAQLEAIKQSRTFRLVQWIGRSRLTAPLRALVSLVRRS